MFGLWMVRVTKSSALQHLATEAVRNTCSPSLPITFLRRLGLIKIHTESHDSNLPRMYPVAQCYETHTILDVLPEEHVQKTLSFCQNKGSFSIPTALHPQSKHPTSWSVQAAVTEPVLQLHACLLILLWEVPIGWPGYCPPAEQNSKMPWELLLLAFVLPSPLVGLSCSHGRGGVGLPKAAQVH